MSYRQELRAAELAVIEAAWPIAQAYRHDDGVHTFLLTFDDVEHLVATVDVLKALRSQLDAPIAPSSDDDTSANAAKMALPMVAGLRRRIIFHIAKRERYPIPGATDDMLERLTGRSHQSVSAARRSLVQMGWLHDSGLKGDTRTGRPAVLWTLTPFGKDSVVKLALDSSTAAFKAIADAGRQIGDATDV